MCLVGKLGGADAGAIVGSQAIEDALDNGHPPFVFGDFLLVRQFHTIHTDQAAVVNSPRRKPLRRCHDFIEFRLAEVRAKCLNAPGELWVNHPAVKYSQTFKAALANLIQH